MKKNPMKKPYKLRSRLIITLLLSSLIPLFLLGLTSYYSFYSLLQNKVEGGIRNSLEIERINVEAVYSTLDFASKQLSYGKTGSSILSYMDTRNYDQYEAAKAISNSLETIMYTNPTIGTVFYYLPGSGDVLFNFFNVKPGLDSTAFQTLSAGHDVRYHAPHEPMNAIEDKPQVLSVMRKVQSPDRKEEIYAYLETTGATLSEVFRDNQYRYNITRLLINGDGQVVYSDNPQWIQSGSMLQYESYQDNPLMDGHYLYRDKGTQGWELAVLIKKDEVNAEINEWLINYSLIALVSLLVSLGLAYILWRNFYSPLVVFKREIQMISNNQWTSSQKLMGIREFDDLLVSFSNMKVRISELLEEVQTKEKKKKQLEIEKLLYQINPHFLYNTLNTIQWYGMMSGHKEIVTLAKAFSRVLHYNLGKEGTIVTVSAEIEALHDYIQLQQIRYNYNFRIEIQAEPETLPKNLPRFILQPLVENALYHAFKDEGGQIVVRSVLDEENHLEITVADNGQGISEERLKTLFTDDGSRKKKSGLGIGLSYVNNQIKAHYGEQYGLQVLSKLGEGTMMRIRVPSEIREEQAYD